jgi:putative ABC transport system permease protein
MKTTETFIAGLKNIFAHKLRSILTLSGIVIGVAAVTTMFSSVDAMKQLIEDAINSIGYDNVIVLYSSFSGFQDNKLKKYPSVQRFKYLTYKDYEGLKSNLKDVELIYPTINDERTCAINGRESKVRLQGIENVFFRSKNYSIKLGRLFNAIEENNGENVCILGSRLYEKFFLSQKQDTVKSGTNNDALGQFVSIGDIRLKIVGVLKEDILSKGGAIQANTWERRRDQESCFLPSRCAAKYLRPNMQVDNIWVKATESEMVGAVYNQTRQLIFARHNMADDIKIKDISEQMMEARQQVNTYLKNWNIILLCISSISLFTGGIGLFSILLISIRERMKEIGIRKSMGAKNSDIFAHFLFESVILALIGGIVGSGLAFILIKFLSTKIEYAVSIPIIGVVIGLMFAIGVGLLSGLYPAYKASKINPVKAIFYTE